MLTKIAGRAIGVGFLVLGFTCAISASAQQAPEMNQNGTHPSPPAPATQQSNPQPAQQRGQQNSGAAQPATPAQENQAQGTQSQPQATQSQGDQASADQSPKAEQPNAAPTAASPPAKIELPIGTHIPLVLHNGVSTRTARVGDPVYFETLFPIMQDGRIIIPAGSYVSGEITETKRPGRVKGRGELMLRLETLILPNAYMVRFDGSPASAGT